MGNAINSCVFVPPVQVPEINTENTEFVLTKNGHKIPVAWYTPQKKNSSILETKNLNDLNARNNSNNFNFGLREFLKHFPEFSRNKSQNSSLAKTHSKRKDNQNSSWTIIFSHGNAESITLLSDWAQRLAEILTVNVLLYEYSGYPYAEGECSEKNTYACIERAFEYAVKEKHINQDHIILMGFSLGTGATTHIATEKDVAGVILVSSFTSCVRTQVELSYLSIIDQFTNITKAAKIKSPTLLIHGTDDQRIPIRHAKELYSKLKKPVEPVWIEGADHCNMDEGNFGDQFYAALNNFLDWLRLERRKKKKNIYKRRSRFTRKLVSERYVPSVKKTLSKKGWIDI
ncbi:hypothetical protein M0811_01297 [Anaeramoeba ignava]|uniref:Peptidase S9 prolyl oligopeptidase catalytic domain-containing protein n=1 Tax=Anaeramoeba ignava TaxID=1746090 RepID=A0A9Q0RAA1_ANAIG|nr:hypothetical protein M0811_01297 [Anaeramoeba ignava]